MAKNFHTGLIIIGDSTGAVKAVRLTDKALSDLNRKNKRAANDSARAWDKAKKSMFGLKGAVGGLAAALAGLASINALGRVIDDIDKIGKLSGRLGIATEALSELRHAADLSAVPFQTLATGMQRMTRRVAEASHGTGEAVKILKALNLDARELAQLAPEQQFERIADAIAGLNSQGDRVAAAMKIFDTEGVALLQMMHQGAAGIRQMREEARDLGVSLSTEMTDAAAQANDNMLRLNTSFEVIGMNLTNALIPAINDTVVAILDLFNLRPERMVWLDRVRSLKNEMDDLQQRIRSGGAGSGRNKTSLENRYHDLTGEMLTAKAAAEAYGASQKQISQALGLVDEALDKVGNSKNRLNLLNEKSSKGVKGLTDAQKAYNQALSDAKNITESLRTPTESFISDTEKLSRLYNEGFISLETLTRGLEKYSQTLAQASESASDAAFQKQIDQLIEQNINLQAGEEALYAYQLAQSDFTGSQKAMLEALHNSNQGLEQNKNALEESTRTQERQLNAISWRMSSLFDDLLYSGKNFTQSLGDMFDNMLGRMLASVIDFASNQLISGLFSGNFLNSLLGVGVGALAVGASYLFGGSGPGRPAPSATTSQGDDRSQGFAQMVAADIASRDYIYAQQLTEFKNMQASLRFLTSSMIDTVTLNKDVIMGFLKNIGSQIWSGISPVVSGLAEGVGKVVDVVSASLNSLSSGVNNVLGKAFSGLFGGGGSAGSASANVAGILGVLGAAYSIYSLVSDWDALAPANQAIGVVTSISSVVSAGVALATEAGVLAASSITSAIPIVGLVLAGIGTLLQFLIKPRTPIANLTTEYSRGYYYDPTHIPHQFGYRQTDVDPTILATEINKAAWLQTYTPLGQTLFSTHDTKHSRQQINDMFGELMLMIKETDIVIVDAINRVDGVSQGMGQTISNYFDWLESGGRINTRQDLKNLDAAEMISDRYIRIVDQLGKTETETGLAFNAWADLFTSKFGAENILGIMHTVSQNLELFMQLPVSMIELIDDNIKSVKLGGTPEDVSNEIQTVIEAFAGLKLGLLALGENDIDDTQLIGFISEMNGIGFAVAEAADSLFQYALVLKSTHRDISDGIVDLLAYADAQQLTNAGMSNFITSVGAFTSLANTLGFQTSLDELKEISIIIGDMSAQLLDKAERDALKDQANKYGDLSREEIEALGLTTSDAILEVVNNIVFYRNTLTLFGITMQELGNAGVRMNAQFVEFTRDLVAAFEDIDKATEAVERFSGLYFSQVEQLQFAVTNLGYAAEQAVQGIGRPDVTFENFLTEFEKVRRGLSAQDTANWINAGIALGELNAVIKQLTETAYAGMDDALRYVLSDAEFIKHKITRLSAQSKVALDKIGNPGITLDTFYEVYTALGDALTPEDTQNWINAGIALGELNAVIKQLTETAYAGMDDALRYVLSDAEFIKHKITRLSAQSKVALDKIGNPGITLDTFYEAYTALGDALTPEDTQNWIQAAIALGKLNDAHEELADSLTDSLGKIAQSNEQQIESFRQIDAYLQSLRVNDQLSPLTNAGRLSEAQAQFSTQLAAARAGDVDALAAITQFADEYLTEARGFYASGDQYKAVFAYIESSLSGLNAQQAISPDAQSISQSIYEQTLDLVRESGLNTQQIITAINMAFTPEQLAQTGLFETALTEYLSANGVNGVNLDSYLPTLNRFADMPGALSNDNINRVNDSVLLYNEAIKHTDAREPGATMQATDEQIRNYVIHALANNLSAMDVYNKAISYGVSGDRLSRISGVSMPDIMAFLEANNLPMFADGGITSGPSLAGEKGPEAIIPLPDGRNVPVNLQGGMSDALLRELVAEVAQLRKENAELTAAIIESNYDANEQAAAEIGRSAQKSAERSRWMQSRKVEPV